jgi:hypothetical protein
LTWLISQVDITEDQTSSEQLRESFRGIATDKVRYCAMVLLGTNSMNAQLFVTELDLRIAHLSQSAIDYLREAMPSASNEAGEPEYDYDHWLVDVFA